MPVAPEFTDECKSIIKSAYSNAVREHARRGALERSTP
jgi:hypothetical protein